MERIADRLCHIACKQIRTIELDSIFEIIEYEDIVE